MAVLLNTGLDRRSVELVLALCEAGVSPDALAAAIGEVRDKADSTGSTSTERRAAAR